MMKMIIILFGKVRIKIQEVKNHKLLPATLYISSKFTTIQKKMTDKPKRPLSAYMIWLNSAREGIKREHPGIKVTEIAKKGGEIWRGMKDKSEWEAKAAKAKDRNESCQRI
ncbi:hypothetical protein DOY81_009909 [Sarcophaga bullata]|nr:hypothetical protein DOY81_009909 [Sarcophaga bullata]